MVYAHVAVARIIASSANTALTTTIELSEPEVHTYVTRLERYRLFFFEVKPKTGAAAPHMCKDDVVY